MKQQFLTLEIAADPAGNFVFLARSRQHRRPKFQSYGLVWIWEMRAQWSLSPILLSTLIRVGPAAGRAHRNV